MKYEEMSDFEINNAVAKALGMKVILDYSECPMTFNAVYHERYPHTIWAAKCDERGEQIDAWEQKVFTRSPEDAWPIIVENAICINAMAGGDFTLWYAHDKFYTNPDDAVYDENPLRAAMICFLKMKDAECKN